MGCSIRFACGSKRTNSGGALALVSGRTIADLDRLFAPLTLKASGVHGSEFRFGRRSGVVFGSRPHPFPPTVWSGPFRHFSLPFLRVFAENKLYSYAVHFRAAPELASRSASRARTLFGRAAPALNCKILRRTFRLRLEAARHRQRRRDRTLHGKASLSRAPSGFHRRRHVTDTPGFAHGPARSEDRPTRSAMSCRT